MGDQKPEAASAQPGEPPTWLVAGAAAGSAATLCMTAVMMALHRALPRGQRYPLPPRQIALRVAEAVRLRREMNEPARSAATLAAHFAFGTATGVAYAPLAAALRSTPACAGAGVAFGLLVWLVSYAGWLPAVGLYAPPQNQPAARNALMVAAHVVWGGMTGLLIGPIGQALDARHQGSRRG